MAFKNLLSEQSWKEFFNKHPALHGPETPSKELFKALLKDRYSAYFRFLPNGVDDFIKGIDLLPFSLETMRREAQKFKEENSYYKVEKMRKKLF